MWASQPDDTDPLIGGVDVGEYLVFCIPVPTPGALALMALGGLLTIRRRR
jgi:uncharacterized protein (TIGR03382 family)